MKLLQALFNVIFEHDSSSFSTGICKYLMLGHKSYIRDQETQISNITKISQTTVIQICFLTDKFFIFEYLLENIHTINKKCHRYMKISANSLKKLRIAFVYSIIVNIFCPPIDYKMGGSKNC